MTFNLDQFGNGDDDDQYDDDEWIDITSLEDQAKGYEVQLGRSGQSRHRKVYPYNIPDHQPRCGPWVIGEVKTGNEYLRRIEGEWVSGDMNDEHLSGPMKEDE